MTEPTLTDIRKALDAATQGPKMFRRLYHDIYVEGKDVRLWLATFLRGEDAALFANTPAYLRYLLELVERLREGLRVAKLYLPDPTVQSDPEYGAWHRTVRALLGETEESHD